ncbi:MAG: aminotransferase class V-fold PLP-dependent enzyme [Sphaerochaetaceae bacterium]
MVYLDNAATSWPKAPTVAPAMVAAIEEPMGNVGRSSHAAAFAASRIIYDFREQVASLLPSTALEQIIITRNATEALNITLLGTLEKGDVVLTTPMEHNAVARPLHVLAQQHAVRWVQCACDAYGQVDADDFKEQVIALRPRLAVCTAASNVTGGINPVEELVRICVACDVPFVVDASQAMGEVPLWSFPTITMSQAGGAVCFSLHKGLLGPAGVGVMALYGAFLPRPLWYGGTGSLSDSVAQPDFLPDRYESGTPAIQAIAGCTAALRYCQEHRQEIDRQRQTMGELLFAGLAQFAPLRMVSPATNRLGVVSVTPREGTLSALAEALFAAGIGVRCGFHCAPLAHRWLHTVPQGGTIRFSVGFMTVTQDIHCALAVVEETLNGG